MYVDIKLTDRTTSPPRVEELWVREHEYQHSMVKVTVVGDPALSRLKTGTPIEVSWGLEDSTSKIRTFRGYINHAKPVSPSVGEQTTEFLVVGPSWVLKRTNQRVYKDTTVSRVITDIAQGYGLSVKVDDPGTVYSSLVQSGQSDWEFLVDITKRAGLVLVVDETQVQARDPELYFNEAKKKGLLLPHTTAPQPSVRMFNATASEATGQLRDRTLVTVGPNGAISSTSAAPPSHPVIPTSPAPLLGEFPLLTADTPARAEQELKNLNRLNFFNYQAEATLEGHPLLRALDVVCFDGFSSVQDGSWIVRTMEQKVRDNSDSGGFVFTNLTLGRAVGTDDGYRPPFPRPAGDRVPVTRLVSGVWRAAHA